MSALDHSEWFIYFIPTGLNAISSLREFFDYYFATLGFVCFLRFVSSLFHPCGIVCVYIIIYYFTQPHIMPSGMKYRQHKDIPNHNSAVGTKYMFNTSKSIFKDNVFFMQIINILKFLAVFFLNRTYF